MANADEKKQMPVNKLSRIHVAIDLAVSEASETLITSAYITPYQSLRLATHQASREIKAGEEKSYSGAVSEALLISAEKSLDKAKELIERSKAMRAGEVHGDHAVIRSEARERLEEIKSLMAIISKPENQLGGILSDNIPLRPNARESGNDLASIPLLDLKAVSDLKNFVSPEDNPEGKSDSGCLKDLVELACGNSMASGQLKAKQQSMIESMKAQATTLNLKDEAARAESALSEIDKKNKLLGERVRDLVKDFAKYKSSYGEESLELKAKKNPLSGNMLLDLEFNGLHIDSIDSGLRERKKLKKHIQDINLLVGEREERFADVYRSSSFFLNKYIFEGGRAVSLGKSSLVKRHLDILGGLNDQPSLGGMIDRAINKSNPESRLKDTAKEISESEVKDRARKMEGTSFLSLTSRVEQFISDITGSPTEEERATIRKLRGPLERAVMWAATQKRKEVLIGGEGVEQGAANKESLIQAERILSLVDGMTHEKLAIFNGNNAKKRYKDRLNEIAFKSILDFKFMPTEEEKEKLLALINEEARDSAGKHIEDRINHIKERLRSEKWAKEGFNLQPESLKLIEMESNGSDKELPCLVVEKGRVEKALNLSDKQLHPEDVVLHLEQAQLIISMNSADDLPKKMVEWRRSVDDKLPPQTAEIVKQAAIAVASKVALSKYGKEITLDLAINEQGDGKGIGYAPVCANKEFTRGVVEAQPKKDIQASKLIAAKLFSGDLDLFKKIDRNPNRPVIRLGEGLSLRDNVVLSGQGMHYSWTDSFLVVSKSAQLRKILNRHKINNASSVKVMDRLFKYDSINSLNNVDIGLARLYSKSSNDEVAINAFKRMDVFRDTLEGAKDEIAKIIDEEQNLELTYDGFNGLLKKGVLGFLDKLESSEEYRHYDDGLRDDLRDLKDRIKRNNDALGELEKFEDKSKKVVLAKDKELKGMLDGIDSTISSGRAADVAYSDQYMELRKLAEMANKSNDQDEAHFLRHVFSSIESCIEHSDRTNDELKALLKKETILEDLRKPKSIYDEGKSGFDGVKAVHILCRQSEINRGFIHFDAAAEYKSEAKDIMKDIVEKSFSDYLNGDKAMAVEPTVVESDEYSPLTQMDRFSVYMNARDSYRQAVDDASKEYERMKGDGFFDEAEMADQEEVVKSEIGRLIQFDNFARARMTKEGAFFDSGSFNPDKPKEHSINPEDFITETRAASTMYSEMLEGIAKRFRDVLEGSAGADPKAYHDVHNEAADTLKLIEANLKSVQQITLQSFKDGLTEGESQEAHSLISSIVDSYAVAAEAKCAIEVTARNRGFLNELEAGRLEESIPGVTSIGGMTYNRLSAFAFDSQADEDTGNTREQSLVLGDDSGAFTIARMIEEKRSEVMGEKYGFAQTAERIDGLVADFTDKVGALDGQDGHPGVEKEAAEALQDLKEISKVTCELADEANNKDILPPPAFRAGEQEAGADYRQQADETAKEIVEHTSRADGAINLPGALYAIGNIAGSAAGELISIMMGALASLGQLSPGYDAGPRDNDASRMVTPAFGVHGRQAGPQPRSPSTRAPKSIMRRGRRAGARMR